MIDFPDNRTGNAVRSVLAVSNSAMTPWVGEAAFQASEALMLMDNETWRFSYPAHIVEHVRLSSTSPQACLEGARAGLKAIYSTFLLDGQSLQAAVSSPSPTSFESCFIRGTKKYCGDIFLPVGERLLDADETVAQLKEWAARGVIEPDVVDAVEMLRSRGTNLSSSDWVFVVLGAGAAMGPLETLLGCGANVIAVDIPRPGIWKRLKSTAEASCGTLTFPLSAGLGDDFDRAGGDLLTDTKRIRDWILSQWPGKRLCVGSYAYLDSAAFVRVSLAQDVIASGILAARPDSGLAYLCSPTDCFAIPRPARERSATALDVASPTFRLAAALRPGSFEPNVAGEKSPLPLVDSLVIQQGPNYAFAKRLQHWRAMVARADGHAVSSNVAPASNTASVLKNKLLAAAFEGASSMPPLHIFEPETSNVLMTYLLLHDLHVQSGPHQGPSLPPAFDDRHPLMLFATTAVHNGVWTCPYKLRSVLEAAVLAHYIRRFRPHALGTFAAVSAAVWATRSGIRARL